MNLSALTSQNFRLYLVGNLFSVNALWMLRVTVGWIAWELTQSASFVGLIAFLYFAPTMVAGPLFGVLTDRVNVRMAALSVQSVLMTLAALLLFTHLAGLLTATALVVYSTAAGLAMAANSPIRMSLAPRLVAREDISSVVNFTAINFNLARMTGPALGGWLIASQGLGVTLAVITLCYLPFLGALAIIRARPRQNARQKAPPLLTSLAEGLRHVVADPGIRHAMIVTAISSFFLRGTLEILPVLADGVFERGASGLGVLTSAAGLGALTGGVVLALSNRVAGARFQTRVHAMVLIGLAGMAGLGLAGSWAWALALVAGLSFCATSIGILCQSSVQTGIEDEIRGRVMSLWAVVAIGSSALGAATLGLSADIAGFGPTLVLAAGLALLPIGVSRLLRGR